MCGCGTSFGNCLFSTSSGVVAVFLIILIANDWFAGCDVDLLVRKLIWPRAKPRVYLVC